MISVSCYVVHGVHGRPLLKIISLWNYPHPQMRGLIIYDQCFMLRNHGVHERPLMKTMRFVAVKLREQN